MASSLLRSMRRSMTVMGASYPKRNSASNPNAVAYHLHSPTSGCQCAYCNKLVLSKYYSNTAAYNGEDRIDLERRKGGHKGRVEETEEFPTEGISKPMSEVLKQLNKKVPDSLISIRSEDGFQVKYVPWHVVNRIMNLHAPEWSGEVRNITYSPDGKSVTVVYRVTLYGTDAEIYRESTGTASVEDNKGYGDAVQKAEAMAFRRACARLGLGLHLYHEDMS